jgi:hypothetical protein
MTSLVLAGVHDPLKELRSREGSRTPLGLNLYYDPWVATLLLKSRMLAEMALIAIATLAHVAIERAGIALGRHVAGLLLKDARVLGRFAHEKSSLSVCQVPSEEKATSCKGRGLCNSYRDTQSGADRVYLSTQ